MAPKSLDMCYPILSRLIASEWGTRSSLGFEIFEHFGALDGIESEIGSVLLARIRAIQQVIREVSDDE